MDSLNLIAKPMARIRCQEGGDERLQPPSPEIVVDIPLYLFQHSQSTLNPKFVDILYPTPPLRSNPAAFSARVLTYFRLISHVWNLFRNRKRRNLDPSLASVIFQKCQRCEEVCIKKNLARLVHNWDSCHYIGWTL